MSLGDKLENKLLYRFFGTETEFYREETSYSYSYPENSRSLKGAALTTKNFITPKSNRICNP